MSFKDFLAVVSVIGVSGAVLFLFVGTAYILWPVTLLVIGIYITKRMADSIRSQIADERKRQNGLIIRSDWQHRQIISGDVIGGTYGDYPPHESVRQINTFEWRDR